MQKTATTTKLVMPVIVIAQFFCTSVWFAGNAVISDIFTRFSLDQQILGHLVSAIQFGFISGTLLFAIFNISDRFSPTKVFAFCAILVVFTNLSMLWAGSTSLLLLSRFSTGICLAGIYPVGMKIASDHHKEGLGKALGFLVGALVLGTAFPHLLKSFSVAVDWRYVIFITSLLSLAGGLLVYFLVPDGAYRSFSKKMELTAIFRIFRAKDFRKAAIGYFGHMWELYTFWAFVPFMLLAYNKINPGTELNISLLSFIIIAIGSLGCVGGGYLSQQIGSYKTAFAALLISGICCLISPLLFSFSSSLLIIFLLIWGISVTADSPQFSTLVAQAAPAEIKGTALTIVNSIGFAITIISIQLLNYLSEWIRPELLFIILALGPIAGLISIYSKKYFISVPNL